MRKFFIKIKDRAPILQMFQFGFIGIFNTLVDWSVYLALTRFFIFWEKNYLFANVISMGVAATSSFFCNRRWTFKNQNGVLVKQYVKFILVNIAGLGINTLILYVFVEFLGLADLYGKGFGAIMVFFWGFFMNKYWTFKAISLNNK